MLGKRRLRVSTHMLRLAKRLYRDRPVPFGYISLVNQWATTPENPVPLAEHHVLHETPAELQLPDMVAAEGLERSGYTLTRKTLRLLQQLVNDAKPRNILEFGCGTSTICMASWLRDLAMGGDQPHIYSIDQDEAYINYTQTELTARGLDAFVTFIHAPLSHFRLGQHTFNCYTLDQAWLQTQLKSTAVDMVLIDGPSGLGMNRVGTLVQVMPYLRQGTRFFLDDALRTYELTVASYWRSLDGVLLDGIYLTDRGLLSGNITADYPPVPSLTLVSEASPVTNPPA